MQGGSGNRETGEMRSSWQEVERETPRSMSSFFGGKGTATATIDVKNEARRAHGSRGARK